MYIKEIVNQISLMDKSTMMDLIKVPNTPQKLTMMEEPIQKNRSTLQLPTNMLDLQIKMEKLLSKE